jgi:alpha-glucosidase
VIRTTPDGEQQFTALAPLKNEAVEPCQWWEGAITVSMPVMRYRFVFETPDGLWTYNGSGLYPYTPTDEHDFRLLADYAAPRWVTRSVFYQIFPDRFADGDPANNVQSHEWLLHGQPVQARQWDQPPEQANASLEFYGGDLQGITRHLDYLEQLGVDAFYLNPIFCAPSAHRYDVTDYTAVDPHLGGNTALAELRAALTERNMRLMLDIVPNHCGVEHPWFRAAQADPSSPYRDYFMFTAHPDQYVSWLDVRSLPKLDYRSAGLREYMFSGPESVFRHWLRPPYSIDGWRVDVANMLGQHGSTQIGVEVAREIRAAVKAERADAYLLSEHFFDATALLQGDQYDANMNYRGFTTPLWDWLSEQRMGNSWLGSELRGGKPLSTEGLVQAWAAFRAPLPYAVVLQQFNLIDSHDTPRIRHRVGGNRQLQRLAAVIQFTYPGVPCIFYGDEIGLDGANANMARRTMPWDQAQWDHDLLALYRRLSHLRRQSTALAVGGFQLLYTDADTVAYLRDVDQEQIVVVAYRGASERPAMPLFVAHGAIADGARFVEILSDAQAIVADGYLPLPSMTQGAAIWRSTGLDDQQKAT